MSDVVIFTSCFGGYDTPLTQVAQSIDVDWVACSDRPASFPEPWRTVRCLDGGGSPRMRAKFYKTRLADFLDERYSIWIDANTEIISPTFAEEALACLHDGIAAFRHPQRRTIYAEAKASLRLAPKKYESQPIERQVEHYRSTGFTSSVDLFACGTIARDHDARGIGLLGRDWLAECERRTYQDQLSFPVVCERHQIVPGVFPHRQIGSGTHFGNPWEIIHPHLSDE